MDGVGGDELRSVVRKRERAERGVRSKERRGSEKERWASPWHVWRAGVVRLKQEVARRRRRARHAPVCPPGRRKKTTQPLVGWASSAR